MLASEKKRFKIDKKNSPSQLSFENMKFSTQGKKKALKMWISGGIPNLFAQNCLFKALCRKVVEGATNSLNFW